MLSSSHSLARAVLVVTLSMASAMLPVHAADAQTTTATFNALTESTPGSGTRFLQNCYMENGFVFTAVGVPCTGAASLNAFIAGNGNSPTFSGAAGTFGLTLNSPTATVVEITRVGGVAFSPLSTMLAPFDFAATNVTFTGAAMSGSVTQPMTSLPANAGFQTITFGPQFANVTALRINAMNEFGEPYVRIDNFSATVVPEPSTVVLMVAGLAGLLVVRSRRRNVA